MTKKCLVATSLFLMHFGLTQAATLTIDSTSPELTRLRKAYATESKNITTAASLTTFKKEYSKAKDSATRSPVYLKQLAILEKARDRDLKRIQDRFQVSLAKLDKSTMAVIDKRYSKQLTLLQSRSSKRLKLNYLADLKILEKKLIAKNDLAGAILVQNERKKAQTGVTTGASATTKKKAVAPVVAAPTLKTKPKEIAQKPTPKKATPVPRKLTEANPQVYSSSMRGLAGSGSNSKNNTYTFQLNRIGSHATLSFQGWGTKTTDTMGDVFLIDNKGSRHQIAGWSPSTLKASTFYDVKGADDIEPIEVDISTLLTKSGTYKVEFIYRDGLEAFVIYKVTIQTW